MVWFWLSRSLLPYGCIDLRYLLALDQGQPSGPSDLCHPLFLPLLSALRFLLGHAGYSGKMLMPLELTNLAVASLALVALFWLVERLCADSLTAAMSVLLLGFSRGFWAGALRPDPYALASAASILCLICLIGPLPSEQRRRHVLAGAAAGLAMGFHTAAMALIPVAALAAWLEAGLTKKAARLFAIFLGGLVAIAALGYAAFGLYYGLVPDFLRHTSFHDFFRMIEQEPGTSIYTSHNAASQVLDFIRTGHFGGASALLSLAAGAFIGTLFFKRTKPASDPGRSRALILALAACVCFGLFFVINNTANGFVYGFILATPLLMAIPASRHKALRAAFACAGMVVLTGDALTRLPDFGPQGDPIYKETAYLDGLLRPRDLMLVPGAPFPELFYPRHLNFLTVGDLVKDSDTMVPRCRLPQLRPRVRAALAAGHKVYFALEDHGEWTPVRSDDMGAQKLKRIFAVAAPQAPQTAGKLAALRQELAAAFALDCGLVSPQGRKYCRLGMAPAPAVAAGPALSPAELDQLSRTLSSRITDPRQRLRARYLMDWLHEAPDDAYAIRDLTGLISPRAAFAVRFAEAKRGLLAAAGGLPRDRGQAEKLVDQGIALARQGRPREAEAAIQKALDLDAGNPSAWMSLGTLLAFSGRNEQAVACYGKLLELVPDRNNTRADALAARANALAALGKPAQARQDRLKALSAASASWPWRKDLQAAVAARASR